MSTQEIIKIVVDGAPGGVTIAVLVYIISLLIKLGGEHSQKQQKFFKESLERTEKAFKSSLELIVKSIEEKEELREKKQEMRDALMRDAINNISNRRK